MATSASGASVVVVGGGLVGMSLAYELVSAGADTILIDRHDPGRATDAGAGILSPETNLDPDPGLFAFGSAAARHYATLTGRLEDDGVPDTGYGVTGSLLVAERPGDDETMAMAVELVGRRSPGLAEEIEPGEVSRFFPLLGPVRRALFNPAGRRVDGRVLNEALRRAAQTRGLRVISSGATGMALDRRRRAVEGVVTDDGTVAADTVVIAGGAWSPETAEAFGVTLPVYPLKGQIIHLSVPGADTRAWSIVQPVLSYYLVPWPDGRVACGGTMEASAGFDHRPTADGLHQLLRECLAHRSRAGPVDGGGGQGGHATFDAGRPAHPRSAPGLDQRLRGHRARRRGTAARPTECPDSGPGGARNRRDARRPVA